MKKQNKTKNKKKLLFALSLIIILSFIIILNIRNVVALGITPGRVVYDFVPDLEKDVEFKVVNNEHKDMKILFNIEGELNNTITLYQKMVDFSSSDTEKIFKYSFKLPQTLGTPGIHDVKIIAMELPKDVAQPGEYIGATVAVATQLYIKVPYPGKYLELRLDIAESNVNETTKFVVSASNLGEQKIARAYTLIDIVDKTGAKLATLKTEPQSIDPNQRKEFVLEWKANANSGSYIAKATVVYDEKVASIDKVFTIGTLRLDLVDIVVEDFRLGGIAKFSILVENKWNEQIPGVFARALFFDEANKTIADSKSASIDIPALSKSTMFAYWDTAGIEPGDYDGKILLTYLDQTAEREVRAKVRTDSLTVDIVGITAKVVSTQGKGSSNTLLISLVVLLVLINLAWFLFFQKKFARRKEKQEKK